MIGRKTEGEDRGGGEGRGRREGVDGGGGEGRMWFMMTDTHIFRVT